MHKIVHKTLCAYGPTSFRQHQRYSIELPCFLADDNDARQLFDRIQYESELADCLQKQNRSQDRFSKDTRGTGNNLEPGLQRLQRLLRHDVGISGDVWKIYGAVVLWR